MSQDQFEAVVLWAGSELETWPARSLICIIRITSCEKYRRVHTTPMLRIEVQAYNGIWNYEASGIQGQSP